MRKRLIRVAVILLIMAIQIALLITGAQARGELVSQKTRNGMYCICVADRKEIVHTAFYRIWPDAEGGLYFVAGGFGLPLHWNAGENTIRLDEIFEEEEWSSDFSKKSMTSNLQTLFNTNDCWYAVDYSGKEILYFREDHWEKIYSFAETRLLKCQILDGILYGYYKRGEGEAYGLATVDLQTGTRKDYVLPMGAVWEYEQGTVLMGDDMATEFFTFTLETETIEPFLLLTEEVWYWTYDKNTDRLYFSDNLGKLYFCEKDKEPQMIRALGLNIDKIVVLANGKLAVDVSGHQSYGIFVIDPKPLEKPPKQILEMDQKHDLNSLRYILEHPEEERICLGHSDEFPSQSVFPWEY